MTYTIEDAYKAQDASDMFFNDERTNHAYGQMIQADGLDSDEQRDYFIKLLSEHFGKFAPMIADDFLRRV